MFVVGVASCPLDFAAEEGGASLMVGLWPESLVWRWWRLCGLRSSHLTFSLITFPVRELIPIPFPEKMARSWAVPSSAAKQEVPLSFPLLFLDS